MSPLTYKIIFLAIILIGVSAFSVISLGYFPVVVVNSHIVTEREYRTSLEAVLHYYDAAIKTYSTLDFSKVLANPDDLRRLALEELIENELIHQALASRLGADLSAIIDKKLASASTTEKFPEATQALYGVNVKDFKDLFLRPAAEHEILDGQLLTEKTTFDNWLKSAKRTAKIRILISNFRWDGDGVKVK
jgi:hypothetical protein